MTNEPAPPAGLPAPPSAWVYQAVVTNVVDGDTVDCSIDVGFRLTASVRCRLLSVNCPEVHGPTREAGLAAAEYTRGKLLGKPVIVQTHRSDDFGRWLATVWVGGVDHNADLVSSGHAVLYRPEPGGP